MCEGVMIWRTENFLHINNEMKKTNAVINDITRFIFFNSFSLSILLILNKNIFPPEFIRFLFRFTMIV
ncbi:hypothetical protein D3Z60_08605 [Lachnospiraceae bacterium]|nr:hypothetical protein [Lachnospiraceae bacterium]